ncbi:MAG TPA: glycosyltransferase [bacterium]|nr:glycosyltransferase [bacterium]
MKIALIGPDIAFKGGIAQYNHFLANEIISNGHELKFIGFKKQYPEFLYPSKSGNTSVEKDLEPLYHVERIFHYANPFSTCKALKELNNFHPDIIIIPHWIWFFSHLFVPFMLFSRKYKKIVIAHNSFGHEKSFISRTLNYAASKMAFSLCSHIIVQSIEEKEKASSIVKTGISIFNHPDYNQYLPLIPKEKARSELNIDKNATVFLFLGFVRKYKGAELFVNAISRSENAAGIIAGEFFDKDLENKIAELQKKSDRLIVLNRYFVSSEGRTLISACDAMVLPYLSVTGSGVASIAKACRKPVISSDLPLFKDIFRDYPALFFQSGNEDELLELINDFNKKEYMLKYSGNPDNIQSGKGWKGLLEHILKISEAGNE